MPDPTPDSTRTLSEATLALQRADEEFQKRKSEWEEYVTAYSLIRGSGNTGSDLILTLLKTYGPRAATYLGVPGAAAGLTALAADPGAFGALRSLLGGVASLFGFGG